MKYLILFIKINRATTKSRTAGFMPDFFSGSGSIAGGSSGSAALPVQLVMVNRCCF